MSRASELLRIVALLMTGSFLCLSVGCGSGDSLQLTSVQGKVTFNGDPLEDGHITFTPGDGTSSGAASGPITNGEYSIPKSQGPMVGKHSVSIRASRKTGKQILAPMPAPEGTMIDVTEDYIPYKYNYQTELSADLVAGDNTKDFELVGDAAQK